MEKKYFCEAEYVFSEGAPPDVNNAPNTAQGLRCLTSVTFHKGKWLFGKRGDFSSIFLASKFDFELLISKANYSPDLFHVSNDIGFGSQKLQSVILSCCSVLDLNFTAVWKAGVAKTGWSCCRLRIRKFWYCCQFWPNLPETLCSVLLHFSAQNHWPSSALTRKVPRKNGPFEMDSLDLWRSRCMFQRNLWIFHCYLGLPKGIHLNPPFGSEIWAPKNHQKQTWGLKFDTLGGSRQILFWPCFCWSVGPISIHWIFLSRNFPRCTCWDVSWVAGLRLEIWIEPEFSAWAIRALHHHFPKKTHHSKPWDFSEGQDI